MTDQRLISEFRDKILAPIVKKLEALKEALARKSPKYFGKMINLLAGEAHSALFRRANISSLAELSGETQAHLFIYTCSDLNAVLPMDYPYAVAILDLMEEQALGFFVVVRRRVPGWHELLYPDTVFRIRYKNEQAFLDEAGAEISIKCMHEDLEDLPPDPTLQP